MIAPKKRTLYRYAVDTFGESLNKVQRRNKPYRCNDQDVQSWNLFVEYYKDVNHIFIWHGRNTCTSQNPKCSTCPVRDYCKFYKKN